MSAEIRAPYDVLMTLTTMSFDDEPRALFDELDRLSRDDLILILGGALAVFPRMSLALAQIIGDDGASPEALLDAMQPLALRAKWQEWAPLFAAQFDAMEAMGEL